MLVRPVAHNPQRPCMGKGEMKMKTGMIETIHDSLSNGQRRQMTEQIDEYGLYDFWSDYALYLTDFYEHTESMFYYYRDAVVSYHRIKSR